MKRIPVLFLITDLELGGSPRLLRDLVVGLQTAGRFAPTVVSLKPLPRSADSIPHTLREHGIAVHTLNLASMRQLPGATARLVKLIDTIQPRFVYSILIHANLLTTLALPFVRQRPGFIQSIHTLQPEPAWHWVLQGILAPYADAIVAPSQPILDKIAAYGPFSRGVVIANGIDVKRFAEAAPMPREALPWPPGAPVVGYIGRFDPVKNLPLLLRAFAKLAVQHALHPVPHSRSPHLALVGYGPQEIELRRLATLLHIAPQVHFIAPTTEPERWYKCFTCHCLPSMVEGFGLTIVEAMAAGVPVVAMDSPVYSAMAVHVFGGVLLPPDENLLAQALQRVIANRQGSPHFSPPIAFSPPQATPEALEHLEKHFSIRRMVELHEEFFKNF